MPLRISVVTLLCISCASTTSTTAAAPVIPRVVTSTTPAPWWKGAVFYEIFVRSFKDSNGDGIGDLRGLTEKLDYLNDGDPKTTTDLGVDALWLMPVFGSPSYHGYDTTDYEHLNAQYGTDAEFANFLAEAHKRGIKVMVDLVINHTSVKHPWFVESASSPSSPKRDWYVWSPTNLGWGQPWNASSPTWHQRGDAWYYGLFWAGMPDLNFRTPAVREEMKRIAVEWARRGIDGFRLDAIRHLIETGPGAGQAGSEENHVYLRELAAALKAVRPDIALVGEIWSTTEDIAPYFGNGTDELHMNFDFPLAGALVSTAWSGDSTKLLEQLASEQKLFPAAAVTAPFLTNHDQPRVATALAKDSKRLGLAAAMLLTLPGAPFIYYGEELGLPNGPGNADEWKRTPMFWDATANAGFTSGTPWHETATEQVVAPVSAQQKDATSLWARYRSLVQLRHASPALGRGSLEVLDAGTAKAVAWLRRDGSEQVLVVHNLAATEQVVKLSGRGDGQFEPLFLDPGATVTGVPGVWSASLPPLSTAVVRLK